ncbi:quinone oxidoreductase family protein [Oceanicoccus sagamiensis]|uniref:NADPH:quinone reductase n=1 Tax=Oceanicoccus sagamiensis TaxID=716816 RepID=A0A1X9N8L2_9GAMM|nr:quinone oxidoreductase [Oceanicoccus sagamiensis]ARN74016.1 quinone oxidoreductase [Oceanicoccus sagamiensis]
MSKAIVISQPGDSSAMQWQDIELAPLGANQARIKHTVVGFNMIDTYMRKGLYPVELPAVLGVEGVGVVEAIGADVSHIAVGDRVAYMTREPGAYAEQRNVDAMRLVSIPDGISDEVAAASFLKGLTVWALLTESYSVKAGDNVLIYAAAGGVGSLMCQWAKALGARVIGVVGSGAKVALAKQYGCDEVINRNEQDILATVKTLTNDEGVQVVYDSLGAATFETSLDCIAPLGSMVSFGNATGAVPPFNILGLAARGSLKLVRPQVFAYVEKREHLERGAAALFDMIQREKMRVEISQRIPMPEAAKAHDTVESGNTTGATVLVL